MARKRKVPGMEDSVSFSWVEVIKRASARSKIPQERLASAYKVITEEILIVLEEGNSVALQNFGTFEVKTRGGKFNINKIAPHTDGEGTDPSTVESIIPPMKYMKFTPSRSTKARLRGVKASEEVQAEE